MGKQVRLSWRQLSLRSFLLLALIAGILAGLAGPPCYRWLREQWAQDKPALRKIDSIASPTPLSRPNATASDWSVWESAETPLD